MAIPLEHSCQLQDLTVSSEPRPELRASLAALPKVNLHCHIPGSLRPETFVDLARDQRLSVPYDLESARRLICVGLHRSNTLATVLAHIAATYAVLQTPEALERAAYECAINNARVGVRYLEARAAPTLHTRRGLTVAEVLVALRRGLDGAARETGIGVGLIVCLTRDMRLDEAMAVCRTALAQADQGVVGLDLAGDEQLFAATPFAPAFQLAREAGLGVTVHAGELGDPDAVREAVVVLGAQRVGHGLGAARDLELLTLLRDRQVALEVFPISNVITGGAASLRTHPLWSFLQAGVPVSLGDDDPGTFGADLLDVLVQLVRAGLTLDDLRKCQVAGARHAFVDNATREQLLSAVA